MSVPAGVHPWVGPRLPVQFLRPCPGQWTGDHVGHALVRADAHDKDTCVDCEAACRALFDCNGWVWGFKAPSLRAKHCWLKRYVDKGWPTVKDGSWQRSSPWLGGVLRERM